MQHSTECRFRLGSDIGLNQLNASATRWSRLKRKFKKLTLAAPEHPNIHRYIKSYAVIRKQNQSLINSKVIHPLSQFRQYWDILMFCCLSTHLALVPFVVAFFDDLTSFNFLYVTLFDTFLTVILYMEVILKFQTGYLVNQNTKIELHRKQIVKNYILGTFWLDLLGSAPFLAIMDLTLSSLKDRTSSTMNIIVHIISMTYLCNVFR